MATTVGYTDVAPLQVAVRTGWQRRENTATAAAPHGSHCAERRTGGLAGGAAAAVPVPVRQRDKIPLRLSPAARRCRRRPLPDATRMSP